MAVCEPLFKALNGSGVRYVIVGGLAVVLQGHPRLTVDADLVVDLGNEPAMRVVDLFVQHPIPFEELWSRSEELDLQTIRVHVASIPDLIHVKCLAGRPQDHADIEQLERILQARQGGRNE
ncbi:MAG: DUF6036 family nucleotidyltransferase [Acidobacteriota bacterium]